jgi:hypothetical protein
MAEIIVNTTGFGKHRLSLDLVDPSDNEIDNNVWSASFCDYDTNDCELVYFEAPIDSELWELIDFAVQTYRFAV